MNVGAVWLVVRGARPFSATNFSSASYVLRFVHEVMPAAVNLKQKLDARELTLGMMITNHLWLEMIEIAQYAGLDYVIVDLEHATHDSTLVADACRLGRMTDFPVLVRPARTERESVRLASDTGACGVLLPMIEGVEQFDETCNGLLMPLRGERRPGGHGNWWPDDFNYETWRDQVEAHWIVLPQIESPTGLANARAIAQHSMVTAMAVGPYGLSARLGVCWNFDDVQLCEALGTIREAGEAAGKTMWIIGDPAVLIEAGYHFICVAELSIFLRASLKHLVQRLHSGG